MLKAAREYGVPQLIFYSITPPRRMTRNGFTNATDDKLGFNIKPGMEADYARYLSGIVGHFRSEGYPVSYLSPINEPDYEWNGVPNRSSQEGARASNDEILRVNRVIREELDRRKLPVQLVTPETSSPQIGYEENGQMTRKYGVDYGRYATLFADHPEWRKAVNPIYAYHSYWADSLENMVPNRQKLRQELDKSPGLRAWMTEYCQMHGPRGEGGWGRDLGMTYAINLARLIFYDLTIVNASAWQYWLAVSNGDYKDGLIYVDDLDKTDGEIFPSKALWALGNYARFIRPGYRRIQLDGATTDPWGILASAYQDPKSGRLVFVLLNTENRGLDAVIPVKGEGTQRGWITSDRPGHNLAPFALSAPGKTFRVPSRSVLTIVWDPKK